MFPRTPLAKCEDMILSVRSYGWFTYYRVRTYFKTKYHQSTLNFVRRINLH